MLLVPASVALSSIHLSILHFLNSSRQHPPRSCAMPTLQLPCRTRYSTNLPLTSPTSNQPTTQATALDPPAPQRPASALAPAGPA
ncbi:uncharacterized protein K452DRAFT_283901 [Aplosporella prunicola CBS 121167]|uniref:Uncharacterized protein n=1 Tax=Aplosporella prunicola CBS 121167 TaxID=1176127 RepID=A0A6A6BN86_9PEZI|nr:uncharacterized protein K452DRAFT_283901 [Aplosporella prunicola CBS 121167]KAF2145546.1 hypothetical protein K452DRAFT_283901 [Aplosporella prunicola CBS 121167]